MVSFSRQQSTAIAQLLLWLHHSPSYTYGWLPSSTSSSFSTTSSTSSRSSSSSSFSSTSSGTWSTLLAGRRVEGEGGENDGPNGTDYNTGRKDTAVSSSSSVPNKGAGAFNIGKYKAVDGNDDDNNDDEDPVLRLPLLEAELASLKRLAAVTTTTTTTTGDTKGGSATNVKDAGDNKNNDEWIKIFQKIDELTLYIEDIKTNAEFNVRKAQYEFYEAFSDRDLDAMRDVWSSTEPNESLKCIHPGMPCVNGIDDIMASWEDIFFPPMPPQPPQPPQQSSQSQQQQEQQEQPLENSTMENPEMNMKGIDEKQKDLPDGGQQSEGNRKEQQQQQDEDQESMNPSSASATPRRPPPPPPQFKIRPEQTQIQIYGNTAVVSCIETTRRPVVGVGGNNGRGPTLLQDTSGDDGRGGGPPPQDFECLNIYKREGREWKMICHMTSPIMMMDGPPPPPPDGLPGQFDGPADDRFGGMDPFGGQGGQRRRRPPPPGW